MKILKRIVLIILPLLIWTIFVAFGFINGFLLRPITSETSAEAFVDATKEKIAEDFVGNLAMTIIENGEVATDFFYAVDQEVHKNTMFPVASISKWLTSFGIMKLVEQGKLELDKPIDDYLTRWQLPESKFDNRKVNIRNLLSHSSGLVDDLGYAGFGLNETPQTIEESLTKASDSPYSEGIAKVGFEPGSKFIFSSQSVLRKPIHTHFDEGLQTSRLDAKPVLKSIFKPYFDEGLQAFRFVRNHFAIPKFQLTLIFNEFYTIF